MVDHEVGYLKISRFAATTYDEFKSELDKLAKSGMKKLILDLQGNPGGYMDRAVDIADEFHTQLHRHVLSPQSAASTECWTI